MSAIEPLLHALLGEALSPPGGSHCDLRSSEGVRVRLASDARDERVMLVSAPGVLDLAGALAAEPSPWRHTVDHPDHPAVQCTLLLETSTGQLMLMDSWHRGSVWPEQFAGLLDDHLERHRLWQTAVVEGFGDDPSGHEDPVDGEEDGGWGDDDEGSGPPIG